MTKNDIEILKQLDWDILEYYRDIEYLKAGSGEPCEESAELISVISEILEGSEEFKKEKKERDERRKERKKKFQNCTFDITEDGEEIVYFDDDAYIKVYEEEDED